MAPPRAAESLRTVPAPSGGLLASLPPPPAGKTGWPWTEQTPAPPETAGWPRISVVTPSFNQAGYIEETIRSVLLQNYPNLEFIVMDGASRDATPDILQKYSNFLSYWTSAPDQGQADAVSRGFQKAGGDLGTYLNSDDLLTPGSLFNAARSFERHPDRQWLVGPCRLMEEGRETGLWEAVVPRSFARMVCKMTFPQPGAFWRSSVFSDCRFDPSFHYCLDHAFFCEIFYRHGPPLRTPYAGAVFRVHSQSKSARLQETLRAEAFRVAEGWIKRLPFRRSLGLRYLWGEMLAGAKLLEKTKTSAARPGLIADWLATVPVYPRAALNRTVLGAVFGGPRTTDPQA